MAGDELVPQLARAGAAHDGAQVERANLVKRCRCRERRRFGVRPEDDGPGPVLPPLRRRQGDQAVLVHGQHGHPRHHVLEPAVGLEPADAPAELLRQGMAVQRRRAGDQRAQQRHLPRREVAPVIAALDRAGHPGAINSFRRSASIDQGSHGERSPACWPRGRSDPARSRRSLLRPNRALACTARLARSFASSASSSPDTGSPGLDLQAQRDDRAPLARIHARRRQQPLQPLDLGAQRKRLPRRPANLPRLGPRRRQLVPPDLELPLPEPRLGAPVDLAATPFLRPPPLPLEQRPPVRFPRCRRGRPASLREGRTGSKLPNRGRDRPQVLCRNRHAYKTTHVERRYQPFAIGPAEMNRNNVLTRRSRENRTLTPSPSPRPGRKSHPKQGCR